MSAVAVDTRVDRRITLDVLPPTKLAPWHAPPLAPAPEARSIFRRGDRFEGTPYLAVRLIGQGGMGEVYEVEHAELGRRAALKVLHRRHLDRPDLAARLREEARLLARLGHPNLVEVFDLGVTEGGRPWFAMPLLSGHDLREELLRRGPMPPERAMALIAQALDGLAAAHAAGFVHRDVKLENLFLQEDGTLKVLDFGVAKVVHDGGSGYTQPGVSPGTPRTMAPEQCAGEAVDARTDVYAMGLALYELITGRGPYDDVRGSDLALRYAHASRLPIAPSRVAPRPVSAALDALVLRALAKAPADRFPSAAEMAAALRRLLGGEERVSGPPSLRPRALRRRSRRAAGPWMTAAVSALAVAFFALGLAFGRVMPAVERAPAAAATR